MQMEQCKLKAKEEEKRFDDHLEQCQQTYSAGYEKIRDIKLETEAEHGAVLKMLRNESKTEIIRHHKILLSKLKAAVTKAGYKIPDYQPFLGISHNYNNNLNNNMRLASYQCTGREKDHGFHHKRLLGILSYRV